jgi:hypothetical protein
MRDRSRTILRFHVLNTARMGDRDGEFRKGVGGPALEGEKLDIFYEAPPGLVKEKEDRPEDVVPDLPGNEHVRDFLAKAPSKGLWYVSQTLCTVNVYAHLRFVSLLSSPLRMPLGKYVQ